MIEASLLKSWLTESYFSPTDRYAHRLLKEDASQRECIIVAMRTLFESAHADAKRRLRYLLADQLDPLGEYASDPAAGYPERLHIVTLQGYFGEVMAGVLAEALAHFGETGWKVPAFLFRFHDIAFDKLELMRQKGTEPGNIPGRSGEDCVAFLCNDQNQIIASLICEAKCSLDHDAGLIAEAHRQVSSDYPIPMSIAKIIEILNDYCDNTSKQWITSLKDLYYRRDYGQMYERCDMVCYVCGRSPIKMASWIPSQQPHDKYRSRRRLEAIEVHLADVEALIDRVYGINEA